MRRHFFKLLCLLFLSVGCSVKSVEAPSEYMKKLSNLLQSLDIKIPKQQSTSLSHNIFHKTAELTKAFKLTSPALWHNFLVNIGLRKRGLCFHWADALYIHLKLQEYSQYQFHLVGANIGTFFEHNALVIVKKGGKVKDGVVIDPWRNSGKLYFSKIKDDKRYSWSHRPDRGCEP